MANNFQAVIKTSALSPPQKVLLLNKSADQMDDNESVFQNPSPTAPEMREQAGTLTTRIQAASSGASQARLELDAEVVFTNKTLSDFRLYVNQVAKGNKVIIGLSGLDVSRDPVPSPVMPAPTGGSISGQTPGTVKVEVPVVARAKTYNWMRFIGPTAPTDPQSPEWKHLDGTSGARFTDTGLPSGQCVHYRCAAVGTKGQGPWGDAFSRGLV